MYCNKKKIKILLKTLDKQNSTCYNTYKNYYETNKVTTKRTKIQDIKKQETLPERKSAIKTNSIDKALT